MVFLLVWVLTPPLERERLLIFPEYSGNIILNRESQEEKIFAGIPFQNMIETACKSLLDGVDVAVERGGMLMNLTGYFSTFPELNLLYERVKQEYEVKNPVHHNWTHAQRDLGKAIILGEEEKANMKIVIAGILLHDIGRLHPHPGEEHYVKGAEVAPTYLREAGFTEEEIKAVVHCVRSNGPRGVEEPKTLEAKICYDVDFSCSAGYVGVARAFHHFMGEAHMSVREMAEFPKERIVPPRKLCTEAAKRFAEEDLRRAGKFWEALDKEFDEEERMIKEVIPDYKGD
jgi:HD superfamily phosphodiesterase